MSMIKYRVHEVAKDFNSTSKIITQILTDYATTPKNHMQVLENDELDVIFEYLTQHNQVSIADIFNTAPKEEAKPAQKKQDVRSDKPAKDSKPDKPAKDAKADKPAKPEKVAAKPAEPPKSQTRHVKYYCL